MVKLHDKEYQHYLDIEKECLALRAQLAEADGMNKRGERAIGALRDLAHRHGWDGVNNSKILEVFLEQKFDELSSQLAEARRDGARWRKALVDIRAVTCPLGPDRPSSHFMADASGAIAINALATVMEPANAK